MNKFIFDFKAQNLGLDCMEHGWGEFCITFENKNTKLEIELDEKQLALLTTMLLRIKTEKTCD